MLQQFFKHGTVQKFKIYKTVKNRDSCKKIKAMK